MPLGSKDKSTINLMEKEPFNSGVICLDNHFKITFIDREASDIFGINKKKLKNISFSYLNEKKLFSESEFRTLNNELHELSVGQNMHLIIENYVITATKGAKEYILKFFSKKPVKIFSGKNGRPEKEESFFLRSILENNDNLIAAIDTNYKLIFCNSNYRKEVEEITSIVPQTGKNLLDIFETQPKIQGQTRIIWDKALKGEKFFTIREIEKNNDNKIIYGLSYQPLFDENGNIFGASMTAQNISKDFLIKERLKKFEKFLLDTQALAQAGSHEYNIQTQKIYWTPQLFKIFGLKEDTKLTIDTILDRVHPKDRHKVREAFERALDKNIASYNHEYRLLLPGNQVKYIWGVSKLVFGENGEPVKIIGKTVDITERKLIENELREKNAILSAIFDSLPIALVQLDKNGIIESIKGEGLNFFGIKVKDLEGKDLLRINPRLKEHFQHILTGMPVNFSAEYHFKNVRLFVQNLFFYNPSISKNVIGIIIDITRLKEAEDELRSRNRQLQEAQKLVHLGSWEWNLNSNDVFWSEELLRIYGYEAGNLNFSFEEFINNVHSQQRDLVRNAIFNCLEKKEPFEITYKITRSDGEDRILHGIGDVIMNEENEPIRIVGTCFDITEKRKTEKELQNLKEFIFLTEAVPQMVWTAKPTGETDYFNQRWFEYTGLRATESIKNGWTAVVHPDDFKRTLKKWDHAIKTGSLYEIEYRLRGKDDKYRWFLARGVPMKNEDKKIIKWFGTCTDIDDQKRLQEKKDEFMSIASHELKTPLTSIKAYIQLLDRLLSGNDENITGYLEKTNFHINRLSKLIDDLLDISRIQAGKLRFEMEEIDFDNLAKECADSMVYRTEKHDILVKGSTGKKVKGDKQRLEQVFENLLSNAIKYSPDADKIIITLSSKGDEVIVSVQDFGIGIPSANQKRIFERFYRVEETGTKFAGLGIGLYLIKEIITRHKGEVWLESEVDKGTTFYFSLKVN